MLLDFDLRTLEKLGGGDAVRQFEALLKNAIVDITNRASDKRPRKILLVLELAPKTHAEQDFEERKTELVLDGVALKIKMDLKLPTRQTIDYDCAVDEGRRTIREGNQ